MTPRSRSSQYPAAKVLREFLVAVFHEQKPTPAGQFPHTVLELGEGLIRLKHFALFKGKAQEGDPICGHLKANSLHCSIQRQRVRPIASAPEQEWPEVQTRKQSA